MNIYSMRTACQSHHVLLDLIIQMISVKVQIMKTPRVKFSPADI